MLIATPFENGNICPHFGRAPQFKIFTVEQGKIVESVVVDTVGAGHSAISQFLDSQKINVVIAGGIGQPAIIALSMLGIDVIPGVAGNADEAVNALLNGTLVAGEAGCGCGCGSKENSGSDSCGCDWTPGSKSHGSC